jgi:hypothetical protein
MRGIVVVAMAVASLFVSVNAEAKPPFNIHWPTQKDSCGTIPQFCAGYHGSN